MTKATFGALIGVVGAFVGEIDGTAVKAVSDYRQALRDITKQAGFPYDVVWPKR